MRTQREVRVKMQTGTRGLPSGTQECQESPKAEVTRVNEGVPPMALRVARPRRRHLDFRLLASRAVREQISVVSSHQAGGDLLWQPWGTNTPEYN